MPTKSKAKSSTANISSNDSSQQTSQLGPKTRDPQSQSQPESSNEVNKINRTSSHVGSAVSIQRQSSIPSGSELARQQEDASRAGQTVNRKKQKRRLKEAAKKAAAQPHTMDTAIEGGTAHSMLPTAAGESMES